MKRHNATKRKEENKSASKANEGEDDNTTDAADEETGRYLSSQSYKKEDFTKILNKIFKRNNLDIQKQFEVIDGLSHLDTYLLKSKHVVASVNTILLLKPIKNHWVTMCVIATGKEQNVLLYKDPFGNDMSDECEELLTTHLNVKIITNHDKDQTNLDETVSGPICVENIKKIVKELKTPEKLLKIFSIMKFFTEDEVNKQKLGILANTILGLAKKEKFKIELSDFFNSIPTELASKFDKYKKILVEQLDKDENEIDHDKIEKARKEAFEDPEVNEIENKLKVRKEKHGNEESYTLQITKNFPEEMAEFTAIFDFLLKIKKDRELITALKYISQHLNLNYEKLKFYFEMLDDKGKTKEVELEVDIKDVLERIPQQQGQTSTPKKSDSSSLERLLSETVLGKDKKTEPGFLFSNGEEEKSSEEYRNEFKNDVEKTQLEEKCQKIAVLYKAWESKSGKDIFDWAVSVKGKLQNTENDLLEAMAIMDRANNLITGGHRFRHPQVLAALIFLQTKNNKGRLCQIQTGEGKTLIVSLVAVVKALQGQSVDVITSNSVLAEEGVLERKDFYTMFSLTVATNNPTGSKSNIEEGLPSYKADILYGTISNFQFDYLKDSFEGFTVRSNREFGCVILDEVDSMLIDNGGHIAKLTGPFPGMDSLRYIYIKIWQELHKAERARLETVQQQLKEKATELSSLLLSENEKQLAYETFVKTLLKEEHQALKDLIIKSDPTNINIIPGHLKEYAKRKLNKWIKNALFAKFSCNEFEHYRVADRDDGGKMIVPVDYANTGVTMKNTVWSDGLHQFVQLKHNIHLTFETLTSSFISNVGYIKLYDSKNIYGMTGTLGSIAEQTLLSSIYNIDFAKLPTYKPKRFVELPGVVKSDDEWDNEIALCALDMVDRGRAVLIIFETEQELKDVEVCFKLLKHYESSFNVRVFANEDNASVTRGKVAPGDVILATNIAGRGTNIKTTAEVEANGGLHVIVGFMPYNQRVQYQAFGRTSRQGKSGTAQLFIQESELTELKIQAEDLDTVDLKNVQEVRDRVEIKRIKDIQKNLVPELDFMDYLFSLFSKLYRKRKSDSQTIDKYYLLQDLKESWAFWLEKNDFKGKHLNKDMASKEFENFKALAKDNLESGLIFQNPYYCISQAEFFLNSNEKKKATKALERAIELCGSSSNDALFGVYYFMFEVSIEEGNQLMERFNKALANVFFIPYTKDETYLENAKNNLEKAKLSIKHEIDYLDSNFNPPENTKASQDLQLILNEKNSENLFMKHIHSRCNCLNIYFSNIDSLIEEMKEMDGGVMIRCKVTNYVNNLEPKNDQERNIKESTTYHELSELKSIGMDAMFTLKQVYDVPQEVIIGSQVQIIGGIAVLIVGIAFPPALPICGQIAGALIAEGICDIVMELISRGDSGFDWKDYAKGKAISYGVSIATMGISAIATSVKVLNAAIKACKYLSAVLRKSVYMKKICEKLAKLVDLIQKFLEKALTKVQFSKLTKLQQLDELQKLEKAGQLDKFKMLGGVDKLSQLQQMEKLGKLKDLTHIQNCLQVVKSIAVDTSVSVVENILMEKLVKSGIEEILKGLKPVIKKNVKTEISSNSDLVLKLKTAEQSKIKEVSEDFIEGDIVADIFKGIILQLAGSCNNWYVKLATFTVETFVTTVEIVECAGKFCNHMNSNLKVGQSNNDTDKIIDDLTDEVSDKMFDLIVGAVSDTGLKMPKLVFDGYKKFKPKKENSYSLVIHIKNVEMGVPTAPKEDPVVRARRVLNLPENATQQDIKRAYRKAALETHPDKNLNNPSAHKEFANVNDAYNLLMENIQ